MAKTYSAAGVDRKVRTSAKKYITLDSTGKYGRAVKTPFNMLYPVNGKYFVKTADGVGTKVLLAQLAKKHDTIGIDAVANVANDCIRCGAQPLAVTDIIDIKKSVPKLISELYKGLKAGAEEAGCPLVGGETADLPELLNADYHINCDCMGEVEKDKIIWGNVKVGDIVIGLRSSGLHCNGFSLVRKVLFKKWGGAFDPFKILDGLEKELIFECLEPTKIYAKAFLDLCNNVHVLAAVNITGDAYLKFGKINAGFEFYNFKPHPIFDLIQKTGRISDKEMLKTFNMGWGFAVVVNKTDADAALDLLNKYVQSEVIGTVTSKGIVALYKGKRILLD